jgi:hypothetical protein
MRIRHLSLLLLFFLSAPLAMGQTFKEFSSQSVFLQELEEQLVDRAIGDAKKEHKEMMEKFTEMWTELNAFTPTEQKRIFSMSNTILDARLKTIPDIRDYIEAVIQIKESEVGAQQFEQWHRTLDVVLDGRGARKDYGDYIEFSIYLYTGNIIFHSPSTEWVSDNPNFRFEIEDGAPKLVVPQLNLKCLAKQSDLEIKNTSGVYYPLEEKWIGKNGTVTWERAGLDPNKVYAVINDYEILMKYSKYDADSVTFYNTDYFSDPLMGRVEDAVRANVEEDRSSFPVFYSYSNRLKISNIDKKCGL